MSGKSSTALLDGYPMTLLLEQAKRTLRIRSVDLRSLETALKKDFIVEEELMEHELEIQDKRGVQQLRRIKGVGTAEGNDAVNLQVFRYGVGLRVLFSGDNDVEQEPLFQIEAVFDAEYLLSEELEVEALNAFARKNVGYHVWPYWRELVQSTASRMRLPMRVEVPHYFVDQTPEQASNESL